MTIVVELFGIPRQRAGHARIVLQLPGQQTTLGEALRQFADQNVGMRQCIRDDRLASGYAANLGGDRFINDPQEILNDGDSLLILSADAGG